MLHAVAVCVPISRSASYVQGNHLNIYQVPDTSSEFSSIFRLKINCLSFLPSFFYLVLLSAAEKFQLKTLCMSGMLVFTLESTTRTTDNNSRHAERASYNVIALQPAATAANITMLCSVASLGNAMPGRCPNSRQSQQCCVFASDSSSIDYRRFNFIFVHQMPLYFRKSPPPEKIQPEQRTTTAAVCVQATRLQPCDHQQHP